LAGDRAAVVFLSVTTLDGHLARLLEPRAPRPELRLRAMQKLRSAGVCVGVHPNPIMPGITDSERSLDRVARAAREHGAMTFGGGALYLPSAAQKVFLPFLEREFPDLAERYRKTFETNIHLSRAYKDGLAERVNRIRERYGFASGAIEYRPELWAEEEQLDLFAAAGVENKDPKRDRNARDTLESGCSSPTSTTTYPKS